MGRPPKVSRAAILAAAARYQPADLQLAALADELGVSIKTIYHYFPSRPVLIAALTEEAVAQLGIADFGAEGDWRAVLRADAVWHYRLGRSHPGWLHGPTPSGARRVTVETLRRLVARLEALGWDGSKAVRAHVVIANWALAQGEAQAINGDFDDAAIRAELANYADAAAGAALARLMGSFASPEALFEDGLQTLLAGIEQRFTGS